MNRKAIIIAGISGFLAVFLYFSFSQITPDEIENAPDWMALETAISEAQTSGKMVLVDVYEIGCQYCRAMERDVYPSATIRTLIDNSFHPVKVNGRSDELLLYKGESMTHAEFAFMMGVTAFPYTIVMDQEGNVIEKRRGFMQTNDLSNFLNSTLALN